VSVVNDRLLATRDMPAARMAPWLRFAAGAVFIVFGIGKFTAHASELASFRTYGLPSPDAFVYGIGALEIVGGALLAAGLLTRLVAIVMAGDMVGAIAVSGIGQGEVLPSLTLAPALLGAMLFLGWLGPGSPSVDERILRGGRLRPTASAPPARRRPPRPP
jgi:putative oxidoreductase